MDEGSEGGKDIDIGGSALHSRFNPMREGGLVHRQGGGTQCQGGERGSALFYYKDQRTCLGALTESPYLWNTKKNQLLIYRHFGGGKETNSHLRGDCAIERRSPI